MPSLSHIHIKFLHIIGQRSHMYKCVTFEEDVTHDKGRKEVMKQKTYIKLQNIFL